MKSYVTNTINLSRAKILLPSVIRAMLNIPDVPLRRHTDGYAGSTPFGGDYCLHKVKAKVKCTLVQTLRLCTGLTAHRGSRGIVLLFLDHGTRRGVTGQRHVPAALYPRGSPGSHCTGGWVDPRAGLDW